MNIFKNKHSIIISIILVLSLFYIYNLLTFINGHEIVSIWFDNNLTKNNYAFLGYISISVGWLGGLLGTVSIILLIDGFKKYWIVTIIGQSLTIIDSLITGIFLTMTSYSILIILLLVINKTNLSIKNYLLLIFWIVFTLSGMVGYLIFTGEVTMINIIDCFCGGLAIYGWYQITQDNAIGYVLFIINDLLYIVLFAILGLYVVTASFVIYGLINLYCLIKLVFDYDKGPIIEGALNE